jgi:Uma2 family endonuclease
MNELLRDPVPQASPARTTQAAEGLLRWRWSVAEIEAMGKAGILHEHDLFELIGGELVPMQAKGLRHELVKSALNYYWIKRLPKDIRLIPETTFRMSEDTFLEPDFVFYRRSDGLLNLNPATALLVIEVADSTLWFDLGRKARIYATFGVRELWVINAETLLTRVHREPGLDGYRQTPDVPATEPLAPGFAPDLSVRLADLELI